ncbi:hypothetical protein HYV86_02460 [Candidatus Woesearchaeota archaeon]|nr:hypothetical protein [Candidatus Woesearchaeota archaeon]
MVHSVFSWILNLSVIGLAVISLAYLLYAVKSTTKLASDNFKKMIVGFLLAGIFSAIRWTGGSLVMLNLVVKENTIIEVIWTGAGIISAFFVIYAAKKAIDFTNELNFKKRNGLKKS